MEDREKEESGKDTGRMKKEDENTKMDEYI